MKKKKIKFFRKKSRRKSSGLLGREKISFLRCQKALTIREKNDILNSIKKTVYSLEDTKISKKTPRLGAKDIGLISFVAALTATEKYKHRRRKPHQWSRRVEARRRPQESLWVPQPELPRWSTPHHTP